MEQVLENIRLSAKQDSKNPGQTASRILRSLLEGKRVQLSFSAIGRSTKDINLKVMAVMRILERMSSEDDNENLKKYDYDKEIKVLCTLPEMREVPVSENDPKLIKVFVIEFMLQD